jgi:3D (Asp-Asp-Asp) domain-containing protein
MKRIGKVTVFLLSAALGMMVGRELTHRPTMAAPRNPTGLEASGGIPVWPWMPGGLTWAPTKYSATPYSVNQVNDAALPQGQRAVVKPGAEGTVLSVGATKATIRPSSPATVANGTAPVHQLHVGAQTYSYDRVMTMMTTAYNGSLAMNGPSGAVAAWNGQPLKPGDVAVDPTVIKLGTYLYIDGYGPARAVDTGSAVVGEHVDLFVNESAASVGLYGIQFHKVYWLIGPPPGFSA